MILTKIENSKLTEITQKAYSLRQPAQQFDTRNSQFLKKCKIENVSRERVHISN